jgi:thiol:disulfide interchange protein
MRGAPGTLKSPWYSAAGVPLYLWYAPGAASPQQLPQVLTPDLLEKQASGDR